jgi:hypothetical protein
MRVLIITLATLFALALALSPNRALQGVLSSNNKPIKHGGSSTSDSASLASEEFVPVWIDPPRRVIIAFPKDPDNVLDKETVKIDYDLVDREDFEDRCGDFCLGYSKGHGHLYTMPFADDVSAVDAGVDCEAYFIFVLEGSWRCHILNTELIPTDFEYNANNKDCYAFK